MSEKLKEVEKMISKVEKKKDLTRNQAIDYMLVVATGRLAALWRYDDSLPEGKQTKGILAVVGRKKRAPKSPKILPTAAAVETKSDKPVKPAKKSTKKRKAPTKRKAAQLEIAEASAAE